MTPRFLLLLALLFTPIAVQADEGSKQLQLFLKNLTTLQADFQQTLTTPELEGTFITNGTLYLNRPGRFRWEYAPPNEQIIVADGNRVWLHDVELEQVSHRSQHEALKGTPALLLSDTSPVDRHFDIRELGEKEGLVWVELLPKQKDVQFNSLRLGLIEHELRRMDMSDSFGQVTRFVFSNITRNTELQEELFIFDPPSGLDLIGDL
ncbi:MAG: outer membrane lipoprotein carrier protein LolA [endosymbiont of Escarpia spicata]|uniref:Outer-membrane lipoprotein carrier protein n=1 Tax=endosymbiont of Escarpia spicata TaxID=2200908 RepID=A0A370DPU8_9GAMM|nr:MAG: outer membrane lipoprotein carrier protein LolA [endosymbiont of Escarpia spicata]